MLHSKRTACQAASEQCLHDCRQIFKMLDITALDLWHSVCLKMQSVIVIEPHNVLLLHSEYRVAFRCGLAADSRLHIARVYRRGSLVELRGLTRIKLLRSPHLCWPDTTWAAGVGVALATQEALSLPLPSSSAWTGRMLSGQSTD